MSTPKNNHRHASGFVCLRKNMGKTDESKIVSCLDCDDPDCEIKFQHRKHDINSPKELKQFTTNANLSKNINYCQHNMKEKIKFINYCRKDFQELLENSDKNAVSEFLSWHVAKIREDMKSVKGFLEVGLENEKILSFINDYF